MKFFLLFSPQFFIFKENNIKGKLAVDACLCFVFLAPPGFTLAERRHLGADWSCCSLLLSATDQLHWSICTVTSTTTNVSFSSDNIFSEAELKVNLKRLFFMLKHNGTMYAAYYSFQHNQTLFKEDFTTIMTHLEVNFNILVLNALISYNVLQFPLVKYCFLLVR